MPHLISAEAAFAHQPSSLFLDASAYLPTEPHSAKEIFLNEHLPGAQFCDLSRFCDASAAFPHKLSRSVDQLGETLRHLGVSSGSTVIVYDQMGIRSAPRLWWILKALGHPDVRVLNGGLPAWKRKGYPLEQGEGAARSGDFSPGAAVLKLASLEEVKQASAQQVQVVDARSSDRFEGKGAEPRPGMVGGHIPQSINLPYERLLDSATGEMLPDSALRKQIEQQGIDLEKPLIATCGSGVSACALLLAFSQIAEPDAKLFDGSWIEWQASLNQNEASA